MNADRYCIKLIERCRLAPPTRYGRFRSTVQPQSVHQTKRRSRRVRTKKCEFLEDRSVPAGIDHKSVLSN